MHLFTAGSRRAAACALALVCSSLASVDCSSDSGSTASGGDTKAGLAGTWLVTRTLVTAVEGLPNGYQDQQTWTFSVSEAKATLSTTDGSVTGDWKGSSWLFATDYYDPRTGQPASLKIEIIGVDPLKGTLENTLYDPTGYRPPTLEGFRLDGVRK